MSEEDLRVRVPLDGKIINLSQLDEETGGHGLSASATEVVAIAGSPVTEQELAAAVAAHVALPTSADIHAELLARAELALAGNAAFQDIVAPTQAQVLAQVRLLTKENNALIRVVAGLLDSLDGT